MPSLAVMVARAGHDTATTPLAFAPLCHHALRLVLYLLPVPFMWIYGSPEEAVRRLIAWSILGELCGFGTMDGPLGNNHSITTALYFRITQGQPPTPTLALGYYPSSCHSLQEA